eukprot:TRINITY_DN34417_c0_g1_i1.p1 TRINITY_DN34417_c0_g1~~TRINITY_DN34417_c0_g1_i1.p1  ORF type:complete len:294 (+),score=10.51 TRINITY_DN34417_c0_g1_i1:218-1099(+)
MISQQPYTTKFRPVLSLGNSCPVSSSMAVSDSENRQTSSLDKRQTQSSGLNEQQVDKSHTEKQRIVWRPQPSLDQARNSAKSQQVKWWYRRGSSAHNSQSACNNNSSELDQRYPQNQSGLLQQVDEQSEKSIQYVNGTQTPSLKSIELQKSNGCRLDNSLLQQHDAQISQQRQYASQGTVVSSAGNSDSCSRQQVNGKQPQVDSRQGDNVPFSSPQKRFVNPGKNAKKLVNCGDQLYFAVSGRQGRKLIRYQGQDTQQEKQSQSPESKSSYSSRKREYASDNELSSSGSLHLF